ncbi:MAG: UDP-N-acetylmuramate--L-alanine ligase [Chitinivibrionia bacterium]|nr:UDP-N-acetylmuramate--L-alanine ligase [Chitinivibrionia bacterium]
MINAKKIYFLGIGGSGCSSMALWLKSRGFDVAGSDISASEITEKLIKSKIFVQIGHNINGHLQESDLVVYSSAIKDGNPELEFAKNAGKTVIKRAKMLGMMMREAKRTLAVCGSAGKSTTTGFFASVLNAAKLSPSVIVGGVFTGKDSGAQIGGDDYFLAEADEYDRSFLEMKKIDLAICTSIEAEHLDIYKNLEGVKNGFLQFFDGVDANGVAVLCVDSQSVRAILARINCKKVTFGLSSDADYRADNIRYENSRTFFDVYKNGDVLGTVELKLIGNHNVLNALAAICAGMELGIDFETAAAGAKNFDGIKRRIEKIAEVNGITVISDYAHHPTKISATLSALQKIKNGRIITVFQPHTFTRTRDFAENFAKTLEAGSDVVLLTEIYPAREKPLDGVSEKSIAKFFKNATSKIAEKNCVAKECAKIAKNGDIVAVVGAGDINYEIENLIKELENAYN